jgi:muramoyltetrapeptide carboxypeptidase
MYHLPHRPSSAASLGVYFTSDRITAPRKTRLDVGIKSLEESGHRLILGTNASCEEDAYAAGAIDTRRAALLDLAEDKRVQYLISGWGGKATIDLFRRPGLDLDNLATKRQAWFGFSDACVLLNALTYTAELVTFYGPNVVGKLDQSRHSELNLERYGEGYPVFGQDSYDRWTSILDGDATGHLIGGNLSTFTLALLSGIFGVPPKDLIFFFECADEDPRVQRQLLLALEVAGFYDRLNAIILGDLGSDRDAVDYITRAAREVCGWHGIPLFSCPTFGHAHLENPPIPIGMTIEITQNRAPLASTDYFA